VRHILGRLRVGNSYINRSMIGAVVGVQPFGGEGLSGTGPKAGGPRYLYRFATERTVSTDTTAAGGNATLLSLQDDDSRFSDPRTRLAVTKILPRANRPLVRRSGW
jgi:RHH-type proline utilization regulon transcriptional repressor/proline dehydrogenase/delta 1-pyrroline-5-carboxylate dehydrogenase